MKRLSKFILWGKALVTKAIKKLFPKLVAELEAKRIKANYEKNFKQTFKVDAKKLKAFMNKIETLKSYGTDEEEVKLLTELRNNAKEINKLNGNPPFFYEPDIIDIHNESVYGKFGPSLVDLKKEEEREAREILEDQKNMLDFLEKTNQTELFEKVYGKVTKMRKR